MLVAIAAAALTGLVQLFPTKISPYTIEWKREEHNAITYAPMVTQGAFTKIPFTSFTINGEKAEVFFNIETWTSYIETHSGTVVTFEKCGIPLFITRLGEKYIFIVKSIPDNTLYLGVKFIGGKNSIYQEISHYGVEYVLFRQGLLHDNILYIVLYDNKSEKNYLRAYCVRDDGFSLDHESALPSLSPPPGSHYEMEPPLFLLPEKNGLRVLGGDLNLFVQSRSYKTESKRIPDCRQILEAASGPDGFAYLAAKKENDGDSQFFMESMPDATRRYISRGDGIPWSLGFDAAKEDYTFSLANSPASYRALFVFDLSRSQNAGLMDFGSNNNEGRVAWSQIYYLNGLLDSIQASGRNDAAHAIFDPILPDLRKRVEVEIGTLNAVLYDDGFKTRAFTVDRSPALFAVQTSRLLSLFVRYARLFPQGDNFFDITSLQSSVYTLESHIESLSCGESDAEYCWLTWPKNCPFYFDGLNTPWNHQNMWVGGIFEAARYNRLPSDSPYLENQRRIIRLYAKDMMRKGAFPELPKWHYWWGTAYGGYTADMGISVHKPEYPGDKSQAWISFRTIDVMSVLSALSFMPELDADAIRMSARALIASGAIYPFAMRQLLESGLDCLLEENVAHAYSRAGFPGESANSVWALIALESGRRATR